MTTISVSQLKIHLSKEIRRVMKGKTLVVTDHRHPVALLSPIAPQSAHVISEAKHPMSGFIRKAHVSVKTDPLVYLTEERNR